ncbi:MAG: PDZ domain-containing protein [Ruminococcaceae bacterium]|nr:PDZ domain-containing protein [Oscillospiraceae bacterium]
MEENKDMTPETVGESENRISEPAQAPACEQCACTGEASDAPAEIVAEEVKEEQATQERACVQSFTWNFKPEPTPAPKESKRTFFAVFGGVVALCLALLTLVLFMGEGGFQIIRTLYNERVVYVREYDEQSGLLTPNEAADVMKKSTVTISVITKTGRGTGSGFVYDDKGHICTNYHVIKDASTIQVVLPDGTAHTAEIVGYNKDADVAVLRVQATGLVPAKLGSSADLLVGDDVVAVGTPYGLELVATSTFGKVSYINRLLPIDDDSDGTYEKKILVIQTDASVNPGNSGGPMADMYGRVVGIVVRKMSNNESLGFAIPIDGAKQILDQIIATGSFSGDNPIVEGRSLLGVTGHGGEKGTWYTTDPETGLVQSSPTEVEGYYYMPADGVYVMSADAANAKGKFRVGDVILSVNDFVVRDTSDLIKTVNRFPVASTVTVKVWRDNAEVTVSVILSEGEIS